MPDAPIGLARSHDEAQLYMDLHPCDRCGSVDVTWDDGLVFVAGGAARRYFGPCQSCGQDRSFLFLLPDPRALPPASPGVRFGGETPSELLDAGEWLWVADLTASQVPTDNPDGAWRALAIATGAMDEILKFIPAEAQEVPDTAFWSVRGRRVRAEEPGRYRRERLELVRDFYRQRRDATEGGPVRRGGVG